MLSANRSQIHGVVYALPFRLAYFTEDIYFHEAGVNPYPPFEYAPYSPMLTSKVVSVLRCEQRDLLHVLLNSVCHQG